MAKIIASLKRPTIIGSLLLGLFVFFVFRHLFFNLSRTLLDWGDSSYIAWQIMVMRDRLLHLDIVNLPNLNQHYPYPLSAFYSDSFVGQAVMALPLFWVKNPVLLYNLIFLLTLALNYLAGYWLFKKLFQNQISGLIGTFLLNNSFYFFDQLIHLQTLSYWPTLLLVGLLLSFDLAKAKWSTWVMAALALAGQFYLSVYLGIFALLIFVIIAVSQNVWLILFRQWRQFLMLTAKFAITALIAGALIWPLYRQYQLFEQLFHQVRDLNEILINSTHVTDFLFFTPGTLFTTLGPVMRYQQFNRHVAAEAIRFPGLILTLGFSLGLLIQQWHTDHKRQQFKISTAIRVVDLALLLMGLIGFIFALGPRLNANGQYLGMPLPYQLFLNQIHILSSIRLVHRWFFLTLLALVYFSVRFYRQLPKWLLPLILIFFVFESVPLNLEASEKNYFDRGHQYLLEHKQPTDVLLEFPFLNLEQGVPVDSETRILLASAIHQMPLFNGYTGLFINDQGNVRIWLERFLPDSYSDTLLRSLGIDYLKINKQYLKPERVQRIFKFYQQKVVYQDESVLLIKLGYNPDQELINRIKVRFIKQSPLTFGESDHLVYLRLNYHNPTKASVGNLANRRVRLRFSFWQNGRLVSQRNYFDLYPLVATAGGNHEHLVKFAERSDYDQVRVELYTNEDDPTPSQTLEL